MYGQYNEIKHISEVNQVISVRKIASKCNPNWSNKLDCVRFDLDQQKSDAGDQAMRKLQVVCEANYRCCFKREERKFSATCLGLNCASFVKKISNSVEW